MIKKYREDVSRLAIATCAVVFAASVLPDQAQAQNLCIPLLGGVTCDVDTDAAIAPVANVTGTLDLSIDNTTDLLGSVQATATDTISLVASSNVISGADNAPALALTSGNAIDA